MAGIFSPVCGYLVDTQIGTFGVYSYAPVFYVFDGLMLVTAAVTVALPIEVQVQRKSLVRFKLSLCAPSCVFLELLSYLSVEHMTSYVCSVSSLC